MKDKEKIVSNGFHKEALLPLMLKIMIYVIIAISLTVIKIMLSRQSNSTFRALEPVSFTQSADRKVQKQVLWKSIVLDRKSVLVINACGIGKRNPSSSCKDGLIELRILVDAQEVSQDTTYILKDCEYRNENGTVAAEISANVVRDSGGYSLRVEAVYFGIIQQHETKATYLVLPQETILNLVQSLFYW